MSEKNKENRMRLRFPHTGGSKSLARKRNEMEIKEHRPIARAELFHVTHTNIGGLYVNEEAKNAGEQMLVVDPEVESTPSVDDALGHVLGKEHAGRVRCMGLGVCPSRVFKLPYRSTSGLSEISGTSHLQSLQSELTTVKDQLRLVEVERARDKTELCAMRKYLEDHIRIQFPSQISKKIQEN